MGTTRKACRWEWSGLFALFLLVSGLAASTHQRVADVRFDARRFQARAIETIESFEELAEWYEAQRETWTPLLPPSKDFLLRQPACPNPLPFSPASFPKALLDGLSAVDEFGVALYPIAIAEDPITRERLILNADDDIVFSFPPPKAYDPFAFVRASFPSLFADARVSEAARTLCDLFDPSRLVVAVSLIDSRNLAKFLYAADAVRKAAEDERPAMRAMCLDGPYSELTMAGIESATNALRIRVGLPV